MKTILIFIFFLFMITASFANNSSEFISIKNKLVQSDSTISETQNDTPGRNFTAGFGFGLGTLYGNFGVRTFACYSHFEAGFAYGWAPLANYGVPVISGTLHFNKPDKNLRPKLTFLYSNCLIYTTVIDESLSPIYKKKYSGYAISFGSDLLFKKIPTLGIELNLCYLMPSIGKETIISEYNTEVRRLENQGYQLNEMVKLTSLKISMGLIFCL